MIAYNVTVKVDLEINNIWVEWMKKDHIPKVLETGCFTGYKFFRIVEEDQTDGITYAVQYYANSMSDYFEYKEKFAPALQKETRDIFPDKFVAHRTILREVE